MRYEHGNVVLQVYMYKYMYMMHEILTYAAGLIYRATKSDACGCLQTYIHAYI
jgi:hypothetical protein